MNQNERNQKSSSGEAKQDPNKMMHQRTRRRWTEIACMMFLLLPVACSSFQPSKHSSIRRHSSLRQNDSSSVPRIRPDPPASSKAANEHVPSTSSKAASTSPNDAVAVAVGVSSARPDLSPSQLASRIVSLGRKGQTQRALDLYESISNPSIRQVNGAMDACARGRPVRLERAFDLLHSTEATPNVYTFGALMSACARAGQAQRACRLLHTMRSHYHVTPNAVVYNSAISACSHATPPQPATAQHLLQTAAEAGMALTVVGYNAAVSAFARAGDATGAMNLLEAMKHNDASSSSQTTMTTPPLPSPDAVTYGTVLTACEKAGEWNLVLHYVEEMQAFGHELDGLAVTCALHACQQLGLAQPALQYFEWFKKIGVYQRKTAGWQVAGSRQPMRGPDAVAYMLAISACARGGSWRSGLELLEEYEASHTITSKNRHEAVMVYSSAVTGCEYAGEWKEAFGLLDRMRQAGVEPNEGTFAAVIGACATACTKLQQQAVSDNASSVEDATARRTGSSSTMPEPLHKALRLLRVLAKDPTVADPNIQVYNSAIRACGEALDVARAFKILDLVRHVGLEPTKVTYGSLMTACERVGSVEGASKVFALMKKGGMEPNEIIYGAAISCCRKRGHSERALALLRKLIREGLQPNVALFNTVIVAQTESRKRSIERAVLVYKLLKSQQYSSAKPNRQTYGILIRALAQNRQPQEAESLLIQMREAGLTPDVDLYTVVVASYERAGEPLQALRLMESMRQDGYDFYEYDVLNAAFKNAVKLVNVVGRGLKSGSKDPNNVASMIDAQDGQAEAFVSSNA